MMTVHVISSATTNAVLFKQGHSLALDRACISSEWQSTPKTTSDNGFIWRAIFFWYFLANNQENAITFCKQWHVYSSHRLRWLKSWQKCNLVGLFIYSFFYLFSQELDCSHTFLHSCNILDYMLSGYKSVQYIYKNWIVSHHWM